MSLIPVQTHFTIIIVYRKYDLDRTIEGQMLKSSDFVHFAHLRQPTIVEVHILGLHYTSISYSSMSFLYDDIDNLFQGQITN